MKQCIRLAAFAAVAVGGLGTSWALGSITIPTVPIGNPGNAADPTTGYGSVGYAYNIGTYEVTNAQYAAFLNAVAATDTNNLYNSNMAGSFGGITQSGSPGLYAYSTVSGRANNPVNYVSFWDQLRFANWLHNGQPTGVQNNSTTEDGAYTITSGGISANTITRNPGWQWAVTNENEWYKAAYHQPASQGGDSDDYWLYPTSSNTAPSAAEVNFFGAIGNTTPVGSYAANYYGLFDMGGNLWELNEEIIPDGADSHRGIRGGAFSNIQSDLMRADTRPEAIPSSESFAYGFRIVAVPGPSSVALLAIGGLGALHRRRGGGR